MNTSERLINPSLKFFQSTLFCCKYLNIICMVLWSNSYIMVFRDMISACTYAARIFVSLLPEFPRRTETCKKWSAIYQHISIIETWSAKVPLYLTFIGNFTFVHNSLPKATLTTILIIINCSTNCTKLYSV